MRVEFPSAHVERTPSSTRVFLADKTDFREWSIKPAARSGIVDLQRILSIDGRKPAGQNARASTESKWSQPLAPSPDFGAD